MSVILAFDQISKSYGDKPAVRDVSFEVREGEVFGLLGPNGAGKTTLIRILMDIIRADAGRVMLFGKPAGRDELDRIGYLPEERGLYKKQKVADVLAYFGELKGLAHADAKRRAHWWLNRIGMEADVAGGPVEKLSKGNAQKVQIAAALLFDPPLAILDEPFSGLDPVNVRLVQEIIRERGRAGMTTILSTHQMNMVEALCDRVALIHRGQLMEYGEVDEMRERWSKPEVRVGVSNGTPPTKVAGVTQVTQEERNNWRLLLEQGTAPADVLNLLVAEGVRIERYEKLLAPMEDIFINVVERVQQ